MEALQRWHNSPEFQAALMIGEIREIQHHRSQWPEIVVAHTQRRVASPRTSCALVPASDGLSGARKCEAWGRDYNEEA
jgi:hypothetical protein